MNTMSDIQDLSIKRMKWVEANRDNGFEEGIKRLLTELYPENAHFIYELLQNAEDAKATEVEFRLEKHGVAFIHNGKRPFTFRDVESITSIGNSTKRDDPTSIGKFGVGFKAVFAYTLNPHIHSGRYNFRIHDLVVPTQDLQFRYVASEGVTRFLLPFDNPKKPPSIAKAEVERNLQDLGPSTLLFLASIRKISYQLSDGSFGFLERNDLSDNKIEIVAHNSDAGIDSSNVVYLRFDKVVSVDDDEGNPKECRISVAYGLSRDETSRAANLPSRVPSAWKIVPVKGEVCIYFAAEKETSKLFFHINAPFASTVARDSVRDTVANDTLRDHIAELVCNSMQKIRDQGLLTMDFLRSLPIPDDQLSRFYEPIRLRLVETFKSEKLTPMRRGGHAAADGILSGSRKLSEMIDDEDISTLLGPDFESPMWVSIPQQRNQRQDKFISSLGIEEWTVQDLALLFLKDPAITNSVLCTKQPKWFQQLYTLLDDVVLNWQPTRLAIRRILPELPGNDTIMSSYYYQKNVRDTKTKFIQLSLVKTQSEKLLPGSHCYFATHLAKFSEQIESVHKLAYDYKKDSDSNNSANRFLRSVGVKDFDIAERVKVLLNSKYTKQKQWCQIVSVNVFVLGSVSGFLFQQVPPHGVGPAVLVT